MLTFLSRDGGDSAVVVSSKQTRCEVLLRLTITPRRRKDKQSKVQAKDLSNACVGHLNIEQLSVFVTVIIRTRLKGRLRERSR